MCRDRKKLLLYLCGYLFYVHLQHAVVSASNATKSADEDASLNDYRDLVNNSNSKQTTWRDFLADCKKPSVACIQKYIYKYLNDTLESESDLQLDFVTFSKNNRSDVAESETEDDVDEESAIGRSSIGADLKAKASKFLLTHDIKFQLPDYLLDGASVEISPRAIQEAGARFQVIVAPKKQAENVGEGRILFKKIKKFFSNKLMTAFLGILVVIKLIKLLLMFVAPAVMGAAAAKQLLVKIILFVFPAMSYFFKLCPYYKRTKFHHHQHHIKHIHHVTPHSHHGPHDHHESEPDHHHPFPLHHAPNVNLWDDDDYHHTLGSHDDGIGYYTDGVSGFDSIGHRKSDLKLNGVQDVDVNRKRGQGQLNRPKGKQPFVNGPNGPKSPGLDSLLLKAEKEAMLKLRLQEEQKRIQAENLLLQEQLKKALKIQEKLKLHTQLMSPNNNLPNNMPPVISILAPPPPVQPPNVQMPPPPAANVRVQPPSPYLQTPNVQAKQASLPDRLQEQIKQHALQKEQEYQRQQTQQQQMLPQKSMQTLASNNSHTQAITSSIRVGIDPFYSPILEKIDKILVGIGYKEEGCRERLICSMYKNPEKFSPHSNLISAELSRDSSELEKPTNNNVDVIRFYKYVQAARDGQDNRDCVRLYPSCTINTDTL